MTTQCKGFEIHYYFEHLAKRCILEGEAGMVMNGSNRVKARKGCKTQGPPDSEVAGKKSQLGDIYP